MSDESTEKSETKSTRKRAIFSSTYALYGLSDSWVAAGDPRIRSNSGPAYLHSTRPTPADYALVSINSRDDFDLGRRADHFFVPIYNPSTGSTPTTPTSSESNPVSSEPLAPTRFTFMPPVAEPTPAASPESSLLVSSVAPRSSISTGERDASLVSEFQSFTQASPSVSRPTSTPLTAIHSETATSTSEAKVDQQAQPINSTAALTSTTETATASSKLSEGSHDPIAEYDESELFDFSTGTSAPTSTDSGSDSTTATASSTSPLEEKRIGHPTTPESINEDHEQDNPFQNETEVHLSTNPPPEIKSPLSRLNRLVSHLFLTTMNQAARGSCSANLDPETNNDDNTKSELAPTSRTPH